MVCLLVRYAHLYFGDLPRVFDHDLGVSAYWVLGLEKVVVCRLFGAERCYILVHVEDVGCIGELHTESWYLASISCSLCGTEILKLCFALFSCKQTSAAGSFQFSLTMVVISLGKVAIVHMSMVINCGTMK